MKDLLFLRWCSCRASAVSTSTWRTREEPWFCLWHPRAAWMLSTTSTAGTCAQPVLFVLFYPCCFSLPAYLSRIKSSEPAVLPNLKVSTRVPFTALTPICFMIILNSNVFMQQLLLDSKHTETGVILNHMRAIKASLLS